MKSSITHLLQVFTCILLLIWHMYPPPHMTHLSWWQFRRHSLQNVKKDLQCVKRDLQCVKRDLPTVSIRRHCLESLRGWRRPLEVRPKISLRSLFCAAKEEWCVVLGAWCALSSEKRKEKARQSTTARTARGAACLGFRRVWHQGIVL